MKQIINRNIDHPERSILTIYIRPEQFSFALYDPEESGSYFYSDLTDVNQSNPFQVFKDTFFNYDFFSLPFRKVWIMNRTPAFTFVPDSIYQEKYKEEFMRFLFSTQEGITLNHPVSSAGVTILHQLPVDIYQFMLRSFSSPEFIHYSAPLITYFLKNTQSINIRRMVVNLQEKGLDIFCFLGNTFLFGNYFPCNGLSDALFYILYTWKHLKLDQLNDYIHITGNNTFREELIDKLTPYLRQIILLYISPESHFDGVEIDQIPFELAALSLCEL